jgi:hypothetical protein
VDSWRVGFNNIACFFATDKEIVTGIAGRFHQTGMVKKAADSFGTTVGARQGVAAVHIFDPRF